MGIAKSLTLNQLKKIFNDFQQRHLQLNSFYYGNVDKIGDSVEFVYPMFGVIPGDVIVTNVTAGQQRSVRFRYTILVADLEKRDDTNETEIHSDALQILGDFISEIDENDFFYDNEIEIVGDLLITPFTERFSDLVTGQALTITFQAPFKFLYCAAPIAAKDNENIIGDC